MAKHAAESYLQIHLPERWPDDERVRWSRRAAGRMEDGACAVREDPSAEKITVVSPAARVAFARARLPRGLVTKLARLASFAIEESIAPSPESVRTALVRHLGEDEWLVAVVDREWLDHVLSELAGEDAEPDRVIFESALVPCESGSWSVVWHGSGGFAVLDDGKAIALDASVDGRPPLVLKLAADVRLATWADAARTQAMPSARARDLSIAECTQLTPVRRISGDALRAHLPRTARASPDGACTPAACGAWIVDASAAVRAASAPAVAPATESAPVAVASARFAAEIATSGGGDGGGGCVVARDGAPQLVLPLLALWAASRLFLRSRAAHGSRRTARP